MRRVNWLAVYLVLFFLPAWSPTTPRPESSAPSETRVESLLKQLTLEQKIDLISGVDDFYIRDIKQIGLPRLKMSDGPIGVRNYGPATTFGGMGLAATWDPDLMQRMGAVIGQDARARGVHFMLGPGVNIYRAPMCGRNFEYFGEDPFLASRTAVAYINGLQSQGVSATIKHFMGNNQEFLRHDANSVIDERTMREIYLPTFEAAAKEAHVGAIMDSYNLTNGQHMTQNGYLNNEVVKKEWGFDGIIMSDWDSTYDGVAAANGGLDLEMPSGKFMNRATLLPAVKSGKVSEATIDDKVRRILRTAIRFGWLDQAKTYYDRGIPSLSDMADATSFTTDEAGRQAGLTVEFFNNPSLSGSPALRRTNQHINADRSFGDGVNQNEVSARWTGYFTPSSPGDYLLFVQGPGEQGGCRLSWDGKLVIDNWERVNARVSQVRLPIAAGAHKVRFEDVVHRCWRGHSVRVGIIRPDAVVQSAAKTLASRADAVVAGVGFDPGSESEGGDRTFQLPPAQDELIRQMAALNRNTIVVITSGGAVDMTAWVEHVPALFEAWYPGQEGGMALAQLLFGEYSPSGKLPATFEQIGRAHV